MDSLTLPDTSITLASFYSLGLPFIFLVAGIIVELVAGLMLLVLSIKKGLSGEKNPKLQAAFWLIISSIVLEFIPYAKRLVPFIGIALFVLVCMLAFGKDKIRRARTIFILQIIAMVILLVAIILFVVSIGSQILQLNSLSI